MKSPERVLNESFGYDQFKPGQKELVTQILAGRDVMGIMPTGAGKSICFQVPALMMDGITLVISPLISLMKDQVSALVNNGIPGAFFNSSLTWPQYKKALQLAKAGKYKIIYVAPERLLTPIFQDFVQSVKISMVAVDEAHCVSQWGQNFRPSYLQIAEFMETLPYRPVLAAFTATATGLVKSDIEKLLGLQNPYLLTTGFDRPNLFFGVEHTRDRLRFMKKYISLHKDDSGIVYCLTRKQVEEVHQKLVAMGFNAVRYHAGLSDEERKRAQDDFIYDRSMIMVATNAFGMGIDKSNVRYVLHYGMPGSLENYYQEAGRAGRDGEKSECILLYSPQDIQTHKYFLEHPTIEIPDPEMKAQIYRQDFNRLMRMRDYCQNQHCLRCYILEYFGQAVSGPCENCSVCKTEFTTTDISNIASAVYRLISHLPHDYGISFLTDLLKGSKSEKVRSRGLMDTPGYGALASLDRKRISEDIESLILNGYLIRSSDEYRTISATPLLEEKMENNEKVEIREKAVAQKERAPERRLLQRENPDLYRQLVSARLILASREAVPPYIICSDQTLRYMSQSLPTSQEEMLAVPGIGPVKFNRYGKFFMNVIEKWKAQQN